MRAGERYIKNSMVQPTMHTEHAVPPATIQAGHRAMPVNKILRDATRMERQKLASGSTRNMFFGSAYNNKPQVGWHVHGTHVFAIPVVATGKVADASTNTDEAAAAAWPPPGDDWPKAQVVHEEADSEDGDRTAAPGPYRVFFVPNIRAQHAWWVHRPEFSRWLHTFSFGHSVNHQHDDDCEHDLYRSHVAEACSNAHRDMISRVDLLKNVLARWDHHARVFRSLHAPHEYQAPPQQSQQHISPVARVVQWTVPQRRVWDPYYDYDDNDEGWASFSCWAWFLVAMLLIFVVLAFIANANWHWEGVVLGDAASIIAYLLLGIVVVCLIGWAVSAAVSSPSSSQRYLYPDAQDYGRRGRYYYRGHY